LGQHLGSTEGRKFCFNLRQKRLRKKKEQTSTAITDLLLLDTKFGNEIEGQLRGEAPWDVSEKKNTEQVLMEKKRPAETGVAKRKYSSKRSPTSPPQPSPLPVSTPNCTKAPP
jgi:hypothetical protein